VTERRIIVEKIRILTSEIRNLERDVLFFTAEDYIEANYIYNKIKEYKNEIKELNKEIKKY